MAEDTANPESSNDSREVEIGRMINEIVDGVARAQHPAQGIGIGLPASERRDVQTLVKLAWGLDAQRSIIGGLVRRSILQPADDSRFLASFGEYGIQRLIGQGGMAVVLRAWDDELGRDVAIKILRPELGADDEAVTRFRAEARATAALRHPNIVTVHTAGEREGVQFLVMEHVDGPSLADRIRERGPCGPAEARHVLLHVLQGLEAAHRSGIVHRDIKPSNILLDVPNDVAKVADFGLAHVAGALKRVTLPHAVFGTPEYMSPEQARGAGHVDERTDLYAVGVVLHEMLTGTVPFKGDTVATVIHKVLNEAPPNPRTVNPSADARLSRIALRLMNKRPEERMASAGEVIAALHTGRRVPLRNSQSRRWWLAAIVAGVAALGALLATWLSRRAGPPRVAAVRVDEHDRRRILARNEGDNEWRPFYSLATEADSGADGPVVSDAVLASVAATGERVVVAATNVPFRGANLFVVSGRGGELWSLEVGDVHEWPDCDEPGLWGCSRLLAHDLDNRPGDEVVAVCGDSLFYPRRIAILDLGSRTPVLSFWHLGGIAGAVLLEDFFGPGRAALAAWGLNNKLDGFGDGLGEGERQYSRWDVTPVVMILDPTAMNGIGPPYSARISWLTPSAPYAYAFLDLPYGTGILHVSYDPETGARREERLGEAYPADEYGGISRVTPVRRGTAAADAVLEVQVVGIDRHGNPQARAGLFVDRDLNIVRVLASNVGGETKGVSLAYWQQYWHVLTR